MKKNLVLLVTVLACSSAAAQSIGYEVDALLEQQLKRFDVPGVGLAIVQNGRVIYSQGYGVRDIKTGASATADTLFAIGSSTKSFTSLGIMQQVEAGQLNLDEPINTYLPKLQFSDPQKAKQVTLRRLLSMTSGLPRADELWGYNPELNTRQQMLETIAQIRFNTEVGKVFQYCNQNFIAAGAALEQVTGSSWENNTKANILRPIGMKRTVFGWDDAKKDSNHATGHLVGFSGISAIPSFDRFEVIGPAGSIHSSANEMGRYMAFQMGTGKAGGRTLITPASFKEMHRSQIAISGGSDPSFSGYGLGWFTSEYRGVKVVEHGGNINGFTAAMRLMPEKRMGFVLLTNLNGANEFTETTSRGLTEIMLNMQPRSDFSDSIYSTTRALLEQTKTFQAPAAQLQSLEGQYALVTGDTLRVFVENGKLFADQSGLVFELRAASSTQYVADIQGTVLALEFRTVAGMIWIYQDGVVAGIRLSPSPTAITSATGFSLVKTNWLL